jgi:hypothetical protein
MERRSQKINHARLARLRINPRALGLRFSREFANIVSAFYVDREFLLLFEQAIRDF